MIKSILNKLFKNRQNNTQPKVENNIPNNNAVLFWIGEDGLPYVKIYIVDTDIESSKRFADMLSNITTGQYTNYILSVLVDISKQDLTSNECIKNIIAYWQTLVTDNLYQDEDNEPHIKPTAFNTIVDHDDRT